MKFIYAAAIALCCVSSTSADVAKCRTDVGSQIEIQCASWKNEFPRPDLYVRCTEGYEAGVSVGCIQYSTKEPDFRAIDSGKFDACAHLKSYAGGEHMRACQSGFASAVAHASKIAEVPSVTVRKLSVKSVKEPKNALEQAREESQAAFDAETRIEL